MYRFFVIRWELFRKPPYYFKYYGFKVYYRKKDGIVYHIGSTGSFEKDVIYSCLRLLPKDAVVFDVGANIGLIALPLAKSLPDSVFHCFEPSPYPYQYFKMTIDKNMLGKRIILNKLGLYDKPGKIKFYLHDVRDASVDGIKDTLRAGKTKSTTIKVTTIDKYVSDKKIKRVDFIKIDIEGAEIYVLKGAIDTIKRFSPIIILEIWPKNLEAYNLETTDVYGFFKKNNYSIYNLKRKLLNKEEFLKATQKDGNYLALSDKRKILT